MQIVTHPGVFHADEILSIALLAIVHGEYISDLDIARTRDAQLLESAKADPEVWVLDVGGECVPEARNFDHHQHGFSQLNKAGEKLSTFGLIVRELEGQINNAVLAQLQEFSVVVDKHDNGVEASESLKWLSDFNGIGVGSDEAFHAVLVAAKHWLVGMMANWSEKTTQDFFIGKAVTEASGGPVVVADEFVPVDERINAVETAQLLISPRTDGNWGIQTLNAGVVKDFSQRCPAPEEWRGKSQFEVEGINVVFCHANGFLTVASSREDAIKLAELIVRHNA